MTMTRHTEGSNLDAGLELISLAKEWGRRVEKGKTETGETFWFLDYWVVRLNLRGMSSAGFAELESNLTQRLGAVEAKFLMGEAKRRAQHSDVKLRYINLEGGTRHEMEEAKQWWADSDGEWELRLAPGPLLCATQRGSRGQTPTHMPWTPSSLGAEFKALFEEAYQKVLAAEVIEAAGSSGQVSDLVDQLSCLPSNLNGPKWNSHSCRRGGTRSWQRS